MARGWRGEIDRGDEMTDTNTERTFLSLSELMDRWGRSKSFVYQEVNARRLAPADHGRWPLAEVKRYEREAYKRAQAARKAA